MTAKKFPLFPLIMCILLAAAARISGIIYSMLATDVIYADSITVQILPALRQLLSSMSFAFAAGASVRKIICKVSAKLPIFVYSTVALADSVTVILYDSLSGELDGRLFYGIQYRLLLLIYSIAMLLIGIALSKGILKHGGSSSVSAATSAVLPVAVDFIAVLWKSITSLIEWEFMPFASEVYTILFELGMILVIGVLSALIAVLVTKTADKE